MEITPYQVAMTFVGTAEMPGTADNPLILAMIQSCHVDNFITDEVPWCSAFVNFVARVLNLPRSNSLMAKSWLHVGMVIEDIKHCQTDSDIVILNRGLDKASGHVGFFAGQIGDYVYLLGGNQNNKVCIEKFLISDIVGMRQL